MATATPFRIPVADLLKRPGAARPDRGRGPARGRCAAPAPRSRPTPPIEVDVTLERVSEGIVVRGDGHARWQAACSRCLAPVARRRRRPRRRAVRAAPARRRDVPARRRRRSTSNPSSATRCSSSCRPRRCAAPTAPGLCRELRRRPQRHVVRLQHRRTRPPLGGPAVARPLDLRGANRWPSRSAR